MSIWVVCEAQGNRYRSSSLELLSQARRLSNDTVAVVLGGDAAAAESLEGVAGKVMALTGANLAPYSASAWTAALADLAGKGAPALVLFGESTRTRELLPRLAARLGAASFTNALGLEADGGAYVLSKPVYGGKAYASYRVGERLCLAAFRPNSFDASAPPVAETAFATVEVSAAASAVQVLEQKPRESKRVDLVEAQRVVAGGRGMKAPENLKLLEDLADVLGGAVGVSRAIVDAGWADHSIQVGKSGRTVSPALYIVAGLSGAVHHTMGMDTSKVVVAVNTDPKAPIFQYADYGIVGDALEVLPALTAELKKVLG